MKAAAVYAKRLPRWRLIPILAGGKRPAINDWVNAASSDPAHLAAWAAEFPGANIGVVTGTASGFFALDVDPKNDGPATLARLEAEHGPLPKTVQSLTPSTGSHYLFQMPDFDVTNSAGRLGPGLDIRGTGGQIVIAPSVTVATTSSSAGRYQWVNAPWNTPIAAAPAWLLDLIRPRVEVTPQTPRAAFPPASDEVLDAAWEALERHGPAVQGQGGDDHTYQAAAILTHDFALTEDEAWPLIEQWNETCQPPWSVGDLRVKLRNGGKYGSAAFGCRRETDALTQARALLKAWQDSGIGERGIETMVVQVRPLAALLGSIDHALLGKELHAATGLTLKALRYPARCAPPPVEELASGNVIVTTEIAKVADEAILLLAPRVFARNGVLCEVVSAERTFISDLATDRITDLMSQTATWTRLDADQGQIRQAPPEKVAAILHARRTHPAQIRVLEAVTSAPVFLPDGTILQDRGYSAEARVYLEPDVHVSVPDDPTQDDARAAAALFTDLLCDFRFESPSDFASWLAGLLSPLVKSATGNAPAPLICVSAASPGAGKTLQTDVIAQIITGRSAEVRTYNTRDSNEWGKRLTAFVRAASPVSVFDNVNGPIGDEGLDRLITGSTWSDRILGASDAPPLPNVTTWFATGNNIEPVGDTVRRALVVRTVVGTERPQERSGFRYDLAGGYALEHRADLLGAALTILRAYHVAGRPVQALPSWGSFTTWSALVRGSLVWAGCADPFLTQQRAARDLNEPENETHDFWLAVLEASDGTAVDIVTQAARRNAQEVLGIREAVSAHGLRKFLGRFVDKPRAGRRIRREGSRYSVEDVCSH